MKNIKFRVWNEQIRKFAYFGIPEFSFDSDGKPMVQFTESVIPSMPGFPLGGWGEAEMLVATFAGKELFEGDIAEVWHSDDEYLDEEVEVAVRFDDIRICMLRWGGDRYPAFDFYSKQKTSSPLNSKGWYWHPVDEEFNSFSVDEWNYKVVGNIHETPELIGGEV